MPTAEVWFGGLVCWWFVFTMPLISANGYLHVLKV
jgi:hypothetical protein